MVTAQLGCVFVFAYAKSRFSHDAAQIAVLQTSLIRQKNFPDDVSSKDRPSLGPVVSTFLLIY